MTKRRAVMAWAALANYVNADLRIDETAVRQARKLAVSLDMRPSAVRAAKAIEELRRIQTEVRGLLTASGPELARMANTLYPRVKVRDEKILAIPPMEPAGRGIDALEAFIEKNRSLPRGKRSVQYERQQSRTFLSLLDVITAFVVNNEPSPLRPCRRSTCGRLFVRRYRKEFCEDACRYKAKKGRSRDEMRTYQYQREARILVQNQGARALEEKIAAVRRKKISNERKRWQVRILNSILREHLR
jgi:hypothetical protein